MTTFRERIPACAFSTNPDNLTHFFFHTALPDARISRQAEALPIVMKSSSVLTTWLQVIARACNRALHTAMEPAVLPKHAMLSTAEV